MVKSMTGFGMGESELNETTCKVEIKTINNRYCDIKVRMPLQSLDVLQRIENIIQQRINRGSVNVLIKIDNYNDNISNIKLNEELLASYMRSLNRLKEITQLKEEINLEAFLRFKEIFEFIKKDEDEGLWETIQSALEKALDCLVTSREEEGNKLMKDISKRLNRMRLISGEIEKEKDQCIEEYQTKLKQKIQQISQDVSLDEGRMEMEVSILAQKSDISEEITRLKSHMSQLKRIFKNATPIGRKIEFYTQEIGREINTIGAKSNHQNIASKVIRLKDELEKIKEQSRNIE
ncbi:MAG: YicC/YloC family endoribonuclease [Elusimicrobiota bacterium]